MTLLLLLHGTGTAVPSTTPSGTGGIDAIMAQRNRTIDAQPLADVDGQRVRTLKAQPTQTIGTQRTRNVR